LSNNIEQNSFRNERACRFLISLLMFGRAAPEDVNPLTGRLFFLSPYTFKGDHD